MITVYLATDVTVFIQNFLNFHIGFQENNNYQQANVLYIMEIFYIFILFFWQIFSETFCDTNFEKIIKLFHKSFVMLILIIYVTDPKLLKRSCVATILLKNMYYQFLISICHKIQLDFEYWQQAAKTNGLLCFHQGTPCKVHF